MALISLVSIPSGFNNGAEVGSDVFSLRLKKICAGHNPMSRGVFL